MPKAPGFKQCVSCAKPMPTSDPHDSCLKCLGESHQTDKCKIYKAFRPRTKKERDFRLRQLLMEAALSPDPPSARQAPTPSASVRSTPAAPTGSAPRVESDKPPRHRPPSAPHPPQGPRRRSLSPGHKKARKAQDTAVLKTPAPPVPGVEPRPPLDHQKQVPATPSTPAPWPLSPVRTGSPPRSVVEPCLPSTPETFATARDLIALTEPAPLQPPALLVPRPVQSRGKPALVRPPSQGVDSRHRSRSQSRSRHRSQSRRRLSPQHRSYSRPRSSSRHRSTSRHRYDHQYRSNSRRSSRHRYKRRSASRGRSRHRVYSRSSSSRSRSGSRHRRGHRHRS
ncbi:CLK4-associating serine/arginine rich protein-like [Chrysemys picta bellii]|uniref:CLK4-associating serine/arginine rich protein-like n=1 Tax=Chrysemys picta bellii TaxID=8478 RepID=UPI0032B30F2B